MSFEQIYNMELYGLPVEVIVKRISHSDVTTLRLST